MEAREERFRLLYEIGRAGVVAHAMPRTIDNEDAADVVAETFAATWRRIDDIPTETAMWHGSPSLRLPPESPDDLVRAR